MTILNDEEADDPHHPEEHIAPVPRISVQAFCETEQTLAAVTAASVCSVSQNACTEIRGTGAMCSSGCCGSSAS